MSLSKKLASLISAVTASPLFAMLLLILISCIKKDVFYPLSPIKGIILGTIFLTVIPTAPILVSAATGRTDIYITEKNKRFWFFVIAISSHITGAMLSLALGSFFLFGFHLSYFTVTSVITIATFKTKVSVHAAGITGPITFIAFFLGIDFAVLYLIVIPVAWARLKLKAHTMKQIVLGIAISVIVTLLTSIMLVRV